MISLQFSILFFYEKFRTWIHCILTYINLYFFFFFEILAYHKVALFDNELYRQAPFLNFGFHICWLIFKISICISSAHSLAILTMIWIWRKKFLFLCLQSFFPRALCLGLNSSIDIFSLSSYSILCILCILFKIVIPCSSPHLFFYLYNFRNLKHTFSFCIIHKMMRVLVDHIA